MKHAPQTFRTSKARSFGYLVLCGLFVVTGTLLGLSGQFVGWFCAAFFGLGVVVFAINLLPNSSFLVFRNEGFTIRSLYREHSYKWSDVDVFTVGWVGRKRMVVFNFSPEYEGHRRSRAVASVIAGTEGALPETYGLSLQELADKMNAAREEALRNTA